MLQNVLRTPSRFFMSRGRRQTDVLNQEESLDASLLRARHPRRNARLLRILGYGLLALLGYILLSREGYLRAQPTAAHPAYAGLGGGQITAANPSFCGPPLTVFQHFSLADQAGNIGVLDGNGNAQQEKPLPDTGTLSHLPRALDPSAANPISYDPQTNTLCANSYMSLYTRYISAQPTSSTSSSSPLTTLNTSTASQTSSSQSNSSALPSIGPDFTGMIKDALMSIITDFVHGLYDLLINLRDQVTSLAFMYSTPPPLTSGNGMVVDGVQWSIIAVDTAVALMLVIAGYNLIMRHHLAIPASEFFQIAPRFLLALAAAHAALFFIGPLIELMNTLTGDFVNTVSGGKAIEQAQDWGTITGASKDSWQVIVTVVFSILNLIFTLLLILQMLVRLALLDLLIVLAPLWLAATALPQTRTYAQLGASSFASTLIVQFLQVACTSLSTGLAARILQGSPIIGLLVSIAALYLAFKIPGMLNRALAGSLGAVHRDLIMLGTAITGMQASAGGGGIPPELWVL